MHDPAVGVRFGALLRLHRRRLDLTQEALAEKASYSVEYIKKLEGGSRRPSDVSTDVFVAVLGLEGEEAQAFRAARLRFGSKSSARELLLETPAVGMDFTAASQARAAEVSVAVIDEERRLVTAVFCDLGAISPTAEELDPEDIRDIQHICFPAVKRQIERYGGTVAKSLSGTILALFGFPAAHENDAERAILCGLGMQEAMDQVAKEVRERWDVVPCVRVGVNTGEVVIGHRSGTEWGDVGVSGDVINTSAELQAGCESGEVLAGRETMWLTRRRIRYGDERNLSRNSRSKPVLAYPALGLRQTVQERWEESWAGPLVGRDREMAQLNELWDRAQDGEGQLVTIMGEAGVGKSRLIAEFVSRVTGSHEVRLVEGRCVSYSQDVTLGLVATAVRSLFSISDQDAVDTIQHRLDVIIPALLSGEDREEQLEARDVLGEVLALPPTESMVARAGAEVRRQALVRGLRRLLGEVSRRGPVILILQDLHWIDAASRDVLAEVVVGVPGLRILTLIAQREGWTAPWSNLGWPERIALRPLREKDATDLAAAVLGRGSLSEELEQYLAERASGNPFFIEELARALEETGGVREQNGNLFLVQDVAQRLPISLTEILLARLDRLEARAKTLAQVGSVIGRNFSVRLLANVMGERPAALERQLTALQQAEIIFPSQSSHASTADYECIFKHVIMREAAYNTLARARRKELHLKAARAIATLYPSDEYVETIAFHYSVTDAGAEAAIWFERAGDRAAAVYSNDAAIAHYEEALRRLPLESGPTADRPRILEKLGSVMAKAGRYDESIATLDEAIAGYRAIGDLEGAANATAAQAPAHDLRGTYDEGLSRCRTMAADLRSEAYSPGLASLYLSIAILAAEAHDPEGALAAAEEVSKTAKRLGDVRLQAEALTQKGLALERLGRFEEQRQVEEAAVPLLESSGDLQTLSTILMRHAFQASASGNFDPALADRALSLAERTGGVGGLCWSLAIYANQLIQRGDWFAARQYAQRGVAAGRGAGESLAVSAPLVALGWLEALEGDWEAASEYLEEASSIARQTGGAFEEYIAWQLAALEIERGQPDDAVKRLEALLAEGRQPEDPAYQAMLAWAYAESGNGSQLDRAKAMAGEAVDRAQGRGYPEPLPRCLCAFANVLMLKGDEDEAAATLMEALDVSRSVPFPYYEGRALTQLGILHERRGDNEHARDRLAEALGIFQKLGARKDVEKVESLLGGIGALHR